MGYSVLNELKMSGKAVLLHNPTIWMELLEKTRQTSGYIAYRLRFESGHLPVLPLEKNVNSGNTVRVHAWNHVG
jgi:hypothetical protein